MVIYNVTVKVDKDVHREWLRWMQEVHAPEMMATGKFISYQLCRLLQEEEDGVTYATQYLSPDLETLAAFQQMDARRLQEAQAVQFPGRFVAFRTAMEVLLPLQST
jgi:hypothetical protein